MSIKTIRDAKRVRYIIIHCDDCPLFKRNTPGLPRAIKVARKVGWYIGDKIHLCRKCALKRGLLVVMPGEGRATLAAKMFNPVFAFEDRRARISRGREAYGEGDR